jgi:NAD(P)-dependent dehydrogenase (short-subunit alcohol dehydrogenase family)
VAFLASPLAGYISGAHIPVDGGAVRIAVRMPAAHVS